MHTNVHIKVYSHTIQQSYTTLQCYNTKLKHRVKCQIRLGVKKSSTSCLSRPLHKLFPSQTLTHELKHTKSPSLLLRLASYFSITQVFKHLLYSYQRKKKPKKKKFCTIYPVRLSITVALAAPSWAQRQRYAASHLSKRPRRLRMVVSGEDGLSSGRRG